MYNFNIGIKKTFIEENKIFENSFLTAILFVFMVFFGGDLKAQNIDGISIVPGKDKIISVKTKTVKSFSDGMISCGDGYFWGVGEADSVQDAGIYRYGKFIPKSSEFQVVKAKIDLLQERIKPLADWNTACDSVNVGGKSFLILRASDNAGRAWIVHEENIYPIHGSLHIISHNHVVVYCNSKSCVDSVNKINIAIGTAIEPRKTHRDIIFVHFSFGDEVILYGVSDNKDYNPFEEKIQEDDINAPDGSYCSLAKKYDKLNEEINRISICTLLSQAYSVDTMKYYENGRYYFFPFIGEIGRVEYYECTGLNSCAGYIFPEGAHLQHESYWISQGRITTFGGFTTRYYDGYGPDYYFCISRKNKNRSCFQRIYPNLASEEGEYNDDSEELRLFFAGGKYYFYVVHEKNGIRTSSIEEITSPF
jgi:hypothetical protein